MLPCLLEVNATSHELQMCVMEKKVRGGGHMFVQQIGNAMCSFSSSPEYLQLASNGISRRQERSRAISGASSSLVERRIRDIFLLFFFFFFNFLPLCCLGSFTWTVFDSLSPPRCTRVHSGGPMNKNAMSTRREERKSPLRAVTDFPSSPFTTER